MRFATPALLCFTFACSAAGAAAFAQVNAPVPATLPFALVGPANAAVAADSNEAESVSSSLESSALPDSPSFTAAPSSYALAGEAMGQSGKAGAATSGSPIAPKYATTILPGQSSQPLTGGEKVTYAFRDVVSPFNFLSIVISATYSQGVDSAPHYGQGWGPYGQRIGAAAARNTIQNLASEAVFAPMFHDDPRYYVLGRQHKFFNRVVYAATRVVVTRSDAGNHRVNAPLLLGYAVAAGANNAYYPQRDRGGRETAISYGTSLGGAVLGMEVSEFLNDALHLVHLRRD